MKISNIIKPKIIGQKHKGLIANFPPYTHMAIEQDNILIAIPKSRSEIKDKYILEKAIALINEELIK